MTTYEIKLRAKFPNAPESFFARQLKDQTGRVTSTPIVTTPAKRIRQDVKPLMNRLEQQWFDAIPERFTSVRAQSKRFKLGNGIWFKPDVTGIDSMTGRETAWEVKGPHAFRGGFENLKVAAGLYPEIEWILVWKEQGAWKAQVVLV
jgi:hypothetical protein